MENTETITLINADEVLDFLFTLDGYGIIVSDEDSIKEFLDNHFGIV